MGHYVGLMSKEIPPGNKSGKYCCFICAFCLYILPVYLIQDTFMKFFVWEQESLIQYGFITVEEESLRI